MSKKMLISVGIIFSIGLFLLVGCGKKQVFWPLLEPLQIELKGEDKERGYIKLLGTFENTNKTDHNYIKQLSFYDNGRAEWMISTGGGLQVFTQTASNITISSAHGGEDETFNYTYDGTILKLQRVKIGEIGEIKELKKIAENYKFKDFV